MTKLKVGVFGSGNVGSYLGIHISASGGGPVTLLGRESLVEVGRDRLSATKLDGSVVRPAADLRVTADPADLRSSDVVLVTVKSRQTAEAAAALREHIDGDTTVVSFQNGLNNGDVLRKELGDDRVVDGMVGFNIVRQGGGDAVTFEQATDGHLSAGPGNGGPHNARMILLSEALKSSGVDLELREDVRDVVAGKLLVNLANGVTAATGLTVANMWKSRDARWCYAQCISEGMSTLRAAGYHPVSVMAMPTPLLPFLLTLPDWMVSILSRRIANENEDAKLSTLQDIEAGKLTEIDALNGSIVSVAKMKQTAAPANAAVTAAVHEIENIIAGKEVGLKDIPFLSPSDLRQRIEHTT